MKVTCTSEQNTFKPVTISITCETPEELFALWHRFNVTQYHVTRQSNGEETGVPDGCLSTQDVWKIIEEEVKKILD